MSAPSGLEIPLFASHEKQHVRLLELPQSVLTELEASDPPVYVRSLLKVLGSP